MKPKYALAVILTAWVAIVVAISFAGGFQTSSGPPVRVVIAVAVPLVLFAAGIRMSQRIRRIILELDPRMVLAAQLWRVAGAAFLFGWAAGELPAEFAVPAGIGDIVTGVVAASALAALLHGKLKRSGLWAFTALGVGDFVVAIVTGVVTRPERLDLLPWVLFPTLAVPFFAILHILSLLQLTKGRLEREPELNASEFAPAAVSSV
ncbi:MAG: hypothetical protein U9N56_06500 [Actinomycetota bacterium]|nr:hypothetical protein [Actinomycetota bacterium]